MGTPDIRESPARTSEPSEGNWKATRTFTCAFFTNENDVFDALAAQQGVAYGSDHPGAPGILYCNDISLRQTSPIYWEAVASYKLGQTPDPTKGVIATPKIRWEDADSTEPTYVDNNGDGLLNSAGDPFPPQGDLYGGDVLTITRNEPYYDPGKNLTYRLKINSDTFSPLGGAFTFGPSQARCRSIRPAREYVIGEPFLPIVYRFEIKADGFIKKFVDQGYQGWYNDASAVPQPGTFWTPGPPPERVATEVLLDGTGKPINPKFKVTKALKDPVANPNIANVKGVPATVNGTVTLAYVLPKLIAFSGMGL